jgi:glycerol-3-phosphate O-acyltransferase
VQNFTILLTPTTSVDEIKAAFSQLFPFLKWEFFTVPHVAKQGNTKKEMIVNNPTVSELTSIHNEFAVAFTDQTTVQALEKQMEESFGLHVQVFRRSGNIWLETTVTDEWTLEFQNEQGRELSEQFDRKK